MRQEGLEPGRIYSYLEVNGFIGGRPQGGIRYSGSYPDIKRLGVFIGGPKDTSHYPDEMARERIDYVGEGRVGDQELKRGNRALALFHLHDRPVHVFQWIRNGRYAYRGPFRIRGVTASTGQDQHGEERGIFVFHLRRA